MTTYPYDGRRLTREALVSLLGEEGAEQVMASIKETYRNTLPPGFDINQPGDELMVAQMATEDLTGGK